jgi:hypothetical protein
MSQYFPDGLTTRTLIDFYGNIRRALEVDDNTPAGQPKPYEARENADFRRMALDLEEQLDARAAKYRKIEWE